MRIVFKINLFRFFVFLKSSNKDKMIILIIILLTILKGIQTIYVYVTMVAKSISMLNLDSHIIVCHCFKLIMLVLCKCDEVKSDFLG